MKSFDDYRKELTMSQLLVSANCCRHAFEAGQQSKQAEIDEQFIANCKQTDHIHKLQRERDELRKRIDAVVEYLDGCDSCCDISKLHLIEVLQGDQS